VDVEEVQGASVSREERDDLFLEMRRMSRFGGHAAGSPTRFEWERARM
jgi:hypothetical protein